MTPSLRSWAVLGALALAATSCGGDATRPPTEGSGDAAVSGTCDSGARCSGSCTDLATDPRHCGSCSTDCTTLPHVVAGAAACVAGRCVLDNACAPGWLHCLADPAGGCESSAGDPSHCGACNSVCSVGQPTCGLFPGPADAGTGDGGAAVDAVVTLDAPAGDVATVTDAPTDAGGGDGAVTAANGHFMCASDCGGGQARCGNRCVDLSTDATHCGSCDALPCAAAPNAAPSCAAGRCGLACTAGWGDCDANAANGCETPLASSAANCGACGTVCASRASSTPVCAAGRCAFTCAAGHADCDADPATGCEVDLRSDVSHCGGCGTSCRTAAHSAATCTTGVCGLACDTGWGDCDADLSTGCEVDVTRAAGNCGACGTSCPNRPHSSGTCTASACGYACTTGFGDCNGTAADGCEVDLRITVANCGRCGTVCPAPTNGRATCTAGACGVTCNAGLRFDGTNCVP